MRYAVYNSQQKQQPSTITTHSKQGSDFDSDSHLLTQRAAELIEAINYTILLTKAFVQQNCRIFKDEQNCVLIKMATNVIIKEVFCVTKFIFDMGEIPFNSALLLTILIRNTVLCAMKWTCS